ncbi:amidohydrolase family protein [Ramlibacter sp. AW1]|uniref:Amidohydrolase family protein n=1 Tax=Ramlibacter aurantiacus TaxID=2801330 RepID=A0A937D8C6_9BURK|nr:amidohydrolase family protein [Ramlibacter aurantiacus]MBL0421926.1 amidohydrolase family protein [Ramlibacter aurantiacus]
MNIRNRRPRAGRVPAPAILASCVLLVACASETPTPLDVTGGTVVRNAAVVDTRTGRIASGMSVVLQEGRISAVTDRPVRVGGAARVVDGSGKFVVPGYLDMHTHTLVHADRQPPWPLLLSHGITGIREMSGTPPALIERARRLNADRAAGRVDAPEVVQIAGPLFVGAPTPQAAAQHVEATQKLRADFVKVVGGSPPAIMAVLREAKARNIPVAGHLPPLIDSAAASEVGFRSMEHLGAGVGVPLDCAAERAAIRRDIAAAQATPPVLSPLAILSPLLFRVNDAPIYARVMASFDPKACEALGRTFARNQTWQVPTLIRLRTMHFSDDPQYRNNPNLAYLDPSTRAMWERAAQQWEQTVPGDTARTFRDYYKLQLQAVKLLKQQGVKMMAGSDYGGIWVLPGFGLHQEFRELAAAGLTPLEVLQMTTLNPAEYLGRESSHGTVEAGKQADLVLLDANPLADVANLDRIAGLFLDGRYFDREALKAMKEQARR